MQLKNKPNSRITNIIVTGFIILLIAGVIFFFIRHRLILKDSASPLPPESTEADLTIKKFNHIASEDGVKKWTLEAASASLYTQKNLVLLNDILVTFFRPDNPDITLKADNGKFNSISNDITLNGNIVAVIPPYDITTENLNYEHHLRILSANQPVKISGKSMLMLADTMTYDIKTEAIKCSGNVKGSFFGNIQ